MGQCATHIDDILRDEMEAEKAGIDQDADADADPDLGRAEDDPHGVEPEAEVKDDRRDSLDLVEIGDIHGATPRLAVDGVFGPNTSTACEKALHLVELDGDIGDVSVWRRFLRRSARAGFTLAD